MRLSIIGGSGFIGSRLCDLLKAENEIDFSVLDKKSSMSHSSEYVDVNVLDLDRLKLLHEGKSAIVNLAAEHKDDVSPVSLYYDVNVDGARNICEAAEANNIDKIIFTSTVAVYGLNKPNPDENFETDPFNDYGKSKLEAEKVFIEWQKRDPEKRSLTIIRPTVVFGEKNRGNVYNLLKQIASGKFLRIGNGANIKSMAYVGNVVSFINHCIKNKDKGIHIYNYVDKPDLTVKELISVCENSLARKVPGISIPYGLGMVVGYGFDFLSKITGKSLPVSSVRIQKFCATTQFDATKAHSAGFKPPFSLQEGLDQTLKHEF
ncbi:MAG: NAD-dependent epimerase/dehydratase family protein [Roseivirga sp.]|nr:NAD-dependent epimerase/dehydratase family protein [Roseivirga sp.]